MKKKNRHSQGKNAMLGDLREFQMLEKALREQVKELETAMASQTQTQKRSPASQDKSSLHLPLALGRHVLGRMILLESRCDALARQAEAAGDFKTSLRAIQVSFRILSAVAKLAEKFPHLAENWQPQDQPRPPAPPETHSQTVTDTDGERDGQTSPEQPYTLRVDGGISTCGP